MHPNSEWLIAWIYRMLAKYGQAKQHHDWAQELAYAVGEEGNDYPSDHAIRVAVAWERDGPYYE